MQTDNRSPVNNLDDEQDSASTLDGVVLITLLFSCCLLPLGLIALPLASAWLSSLPGFVSYRPWLAAIALIISVIGWRRIYRPRTACAPEKACAAGRPGFGAKVIFWLVAYATWSVLGLPYFGKYLY